MGLSGCKVKDTESVTNTIISLTLAWSLNILADRPTEIMPDCPHRGGRPVRSHFKQHYLPLLLLRDWDGKHPLTIHLVEHCLVLSLIFQPIYQQHIFTTSDNALKYSRFLWLIFHSIFKLMGLEMPLILAGISTGLYSRTKCVTSPSTLRKRLRQ
jgi:hypothetical protein